MEFRLVLFRSRYGQSQGRNRPYLAAGRLLRRDRAHRRGTEVGDDRSDHRPALPWTGGMAVPVLRPGAPRGRLAPVADPRLAPARGGGSRRRLRDQRRDRAGRDAQRASARRRRGPEALEKTLRASPILAAENPSRARRLVGALDLVEDRQGLAKPGLIAVAGRLGAQYDRLRIARSEERRVGK